MKDIVSYIKAGSQRISPVPAGVAERGLIPRSPRAVLFDVYGTLLVRVGNEHPRPGLRRKAVADIIATHRLETSVEELAGSLQAGIAAEHERMRARGVTHPEIRIENVWQELFPGRAPDELQEAIVAYELAVHPVWPMTGCTRLLAFLRRRGLAIGIISNAQFYTPLFLRALFGIGLEALGFSPSLCLYSCDFSAAKPGQLLFDTARERLRSRDIAPRETLMIGNSLQDDVIPAARAGFMTVLAALDRRSFDKDAAGPDADAVIVGLAGVERLFKKLQKGREGGS
jgi:putative hydrolase of the HAD superfamily